jgi:hypothetical protein
LPLDLMFPYVMTPNEWSNPLQFENPVELALINASGGPLDVQRTFHVDGSDFTQFEQLPPEGLNSAIYSHVVKLEIRSTIAVSPGNVYVVVNGYVFRGGLSDISSQD